MRVSFRSDWDCPGIQAERWWQPCNHTSAHSTHFPLRSVHHCHLSGNFLMDAANQSFRTYTPTCGHCSAIVVIRELVAIRACTAWRKSSSQEILDSSLCWQADGHSLLGHRGHRNGGVASPEDNSKQCHLLWHPHTSLLENPAVAQRKRHRKCWCCTTVPGRFSNSDNLQSGVYESVRTSQKTGFLRPLGSYRKDGNGALTSVVNMWSAWKCDCVAVIISEPVFQDSPNHFWVTLIF
jgi:hypothetical protein